ncbi:hypothetical protein FRC07_012303 [Ceratobasidium sp. 392]|nr:hypothetical protein FRC07_012303 [Ceratobasidium sp. 392]
MNKQHLIGESGLKLLKDFGPQINKVTGGVYDLVSWEPRGVPKSSPQAACFDHSSAERKFWKNSVLDPGIQTPANLNKSQDRNAFRAKAGAANERLEQLGKECKAKSGVDVLKYVGTMATVRDMVAIHDALDGSKKINFWGFSYGTIVGMYFLKKFLDRIGRVVLDGVVDPEYWADRPPHKSWSITATSIDKVLERFASDCANTPACAFARPDDSQDAIINRIQELFTRAYEYSNNPSKTKEISPAFIRKFVHNSLNDPDDWSNLAVQLSKYNKDLPRLGVSPVTCADALESVGVTTEAVFKELARVAKEVSPIFGIRWGEAGLYCHRWPVRAAEPMNGPWNQNLTDPIVVIGNKADPTTPFKSAKKVARLLGSSTVLIQRDAYGHIPSWKDDSRW